MENDCKKNTEKLDIKSVGGYAVAILVFMSATRLLSENQSCGIPIMNFVSFSNLITYVLDVIYGLSIYIAIALFLLLIRDKISSYTLTKMNSRGWIWLFGIALAVIVGITIFLFKFYSMNDSLMFWLKLLLFVGVGLGGFVARYYCGFRDVNILALLMVFIFSWFSVRVISKNEMKDRDANGYVQTTIVFKDTSRKIFVSDPIHNLVTTTMDFAFIYNNSDSTYSAIPMSEIFAINTNGFKMSSKRPYVDKKLGGRLGVTMLLL